MARVDLCTETVCGFGVAAAAGALGGAICPVPFGASIGALAGVAGYAAGIPVTVILRGPCPGNPLAQLANVVAQLFVSAGVAIGIAKAFGFSVTFGSAVAFAALPALLIIGVIFAVGLILTCCAGAAQGAR